MIRFACPGCATIRTLGDETAGKVGKCLKCQAQFTIPMPAVPSHPPVDASGSAATVRCPVCRAKLAIDPNHLHAVVACPYCKTNFKLKPRDGDPPSRIAPPVLHPVDEVEDVIPRSWVGAEEEEYEEQPRRRSRRRDEWDEDEDEDDYRPRPRRKRSRRRSRGTGKTIPRIISAILSLLIGGSYILCGVLFAIAGSTIMGLIGGLAPSDQQGGGTVRGLAGVGMGVFICCGLFAALYGGLYITAGIGALNRRSWGRTWTIVVAVLSCLNVLTSLYGVGGIGDARGAGMSAIQLLGFVGHAIASFMATFGDGAEAEFNR